MKEPYENNFVVVGERESESERERERQRERERGREERGIGFTSTMPSKSL